MRLLSTTVLALTLTAPLGLTAGTWAQPETPTGRRGGDATQDNPRRDRGLGQERGQRGRRGGDFGGRGGRGGQWGGGRGGFGGFGRMLGFGGSDFEPDFFRRDLPTLVDELELDDTQRAVAEALLLEYEAAFAEAAETARDEQRSLLEDPNDTPERREQRDAVRQEMRDIGRSLRAMRERGEEMTEDARNDVREKIGALREQMNELRPPQPSPEERLERARSMSTFASRWDRERSRIAFEFTENLKAILAEHQLELWPSFDRRVRREHQLPDGRLSGESIDLFVLLRAIGFGQDQLDALGEPLSAYASDLDRALTVREVVIDELREKAVELMAAQDMENGLALLQKEAEARVGVRNVNELYLELLTTVIEQEQADQLRGEFQERAFERIFRPTSMQRAFPIALEMELTDEVRTAVLSLQESHGIELADANRELVQLTRTTEPNRNIDRVKRMTQWQREREAGVELSREEMRRRWANPMSEAMEKRGEMELRYRNLLESVLTPEQIEALPAPPRNGMQQRRGGRGDNAERPRNRGGNDEERAAQREERRRQMIERYDANGDGELDEEERDAARRDFRERGGRTRGGGPGGGQNVDA